MNKSPVDFNEYADSYNEILRTQLSFFSKDDTYFAKYKIDIVKRKTASNIKTILEYGCGIGRNIPFLQDAFKNSEIHGTDISQDSLTLAKKTNPNVHFFPLHSNTNLPKEYYDLIFIAGVFHHIPPCERIASIEKIKFSLKEDGRIFIFEHNPYNPITRKMVKECPFDKDAELITMNKLADMFYNEGLTVVSKGYTLFFPPRLHMLVSSERFLTKLPLGGQYFLEIQKTNNKI